jgi:excisionase family DNA binding protein
MNSESPVTETGQVASDLAAGRLAYSVGEAAQLTGLSRDLLYDQMRRGNVRYVKIGRRRLITRQHLEQFLGVASWQKATQAWQPDYRIRHTRKVS